MSEIGAGGPDRPKDLFGALRSGRIQGDRARLRAAAELMEGQFYQNLFSAMRETVPEGGLTSGGQGEEMFSSLMDQHMADAAASRQDTGLSRALYRVFARTLGADGSDGAAEVPGEIDPPTEFGEIEASGPMTIDRRAPGGAE